LFGTRVYHDSTIVDTTRVTVNLLQFRVHKSGCIRFIYLQGYEKNLSQRITSSHNLFFANDC
jgi:hypothetical protein